ncbi:MAG: GHMP family kinase ATP-binding protein [Planctomycetota bacterium]|jgi:N-acetylgalactosamine kinase
MGLIESNNISESTKVVILAAGKGTRMGRPAMPKVCFDIDGVPAIRRLIGAFDEKSFAKFLIVVGHGAEKVKESVGASYPEVEYVSQKPQLGTGHAAKIAAERLEKTGHGGYVLVTMGDKYIDPRAIQALITGFAEHDADLALLTIPRTNATERSGGRVLSDDKGRALDIVERIDVSRQAIADQLDESIAKGVEIPASEIRNIIDRHIPEPGKQAVAVPELLAIAEQGGRIEKEKLAAVLKLPQYNMEIDGRSYSAQRIEKNCAGINPSLYLFKSEAFYRGVAKIDNDNAQAEYYLTDIVRHLAAVKDTDGKRKFKIATVPIEDPDWIQGFNSPDELLAIQDYIRRICQVAPPPSVQLRDTQYCTVRRWMQKIDSNTTALRRWFEAIYGDHPDLHERKRRDLMKVLECYGGRFGPDEKVCIVRAPGRINLMGRHVDHRGGWNNCLAIDRETIAVVGLRDDDNVEAVSVEPDKFEPVSFSISEVMGRFAFADWLDFVNSDWVENMLRIEAGNWGNYIRAAMLRLQHRYNDRKILGLNIALAGDVPIAAGLSSSSTIVVATLQAAIALNGLELTAGQFVDLCGQGEWFVGSRGGAGDHAAISLGQRGKIAHIGYLPFKVERMIDAPRHYRVVIANSHIKAAKSSSAKNTFNSRIAAYNLGLELLKQRCPDIKNKIHCLRDLNEQTLACDTADIYRMLLTVPEFMTRSDFTNMLSKEHKDLIEANFASHDDPGRYNVRGVLLFGVAEILRSKICVDYLESKQIEHFGALMKVSHDGDRVSTHDADGRCIPFERPCDDEYVNKMIEELTSGRAAAASDAQMLLQPGSYACSTVEIDQMVDIASSVPGVVGAQIAGAGLGGCIMALVSKDSAETLRKALVDKYYTPENLDPEIIPCITAEGAALADF